MTFRDEVLDRLKTTEHDPAAVTDNLINCVLGAAAARMDEAHLGRQASNFVYRLNLEDL